MLPMEVDIRDLVYKLCEGRMLPLLVTDMIAEHLEHWDLFNINILSRNLNAEANAIIYRNLVVNLNGTEQRVKKASLLFRTILTNKTAAQAVSSFSLIGDPLHAWKTRTVVQQAPDESIENPLRDSNSPAIHVDFTEFNEEEIESCGQVAALSLTSASPHNNEVTLWAIWLYVFCLMPNIQDFNVNSEYLYFPDLRTILQDMVRNSSIAKLRSCSLCLDLRSRDKLHPLSADGWDSTLLSLLTVPNIQSITMVANLQAEAVRQLRLRTSSLTRLDLLHYQTDEVDMNSLLAATPSLKYLKYHARSDYQWVGASITDESIWEHDLGLKPLYDALHHVSDSLQELHISQDIDEDRYCYTVDTGPDYQPVYRRPAALSSLKRLQTLTIPYIALLGWKRKSYSFDWDEMLPSSVRLVVFSDDLGEDYVSDPWTDEDLMPIFSTVVEWLSATERGDYIAKFGLHLAQLDREFNEPVRRELVAMCESSGVQCSIEKERPDRRRRR